MEIAEHLAEEDFLDAQASQMGDWARSGRMDAGRDALARRCGDAEDWLPLLSRLVPPPKGRTHIVIGPEEFMMIVHGQLEKPENALIVDGDVAIHGENIVAIPNATVRGTVEISECSQISKIGITCTGWFAAANCPALELLSGEIFGPATVKNCGISRIGADFRVAGTLFLQMCKNIGCLNCEVGGGIEVRGAGVVRTGPAFSAHKYALFDGCTGVGDLLGSVGGSDIHGIGGHGKSHLYIEGDPRRSLANTKPTLSQNTGGAAARHRSCPSP